MSVATAKGTTARELGRSWGVWLIVGLVAIIILSVVFGYEKEFNPLDPRSAQPNGTRALVKVLKDQGVDVDLVFRAEDLPEVDENTTVLVSKSPNFDDTVDEAIPDFVKQSGRAVFLNVSNLQMLGIETYPDWVPRDFNTPAIDENCSDFFGQAREITPGQLVFTSSTEYVPPPLRTCFKTEDAYSVGIWPRTDAHPDYVWVLSEDMFTNQQITSHHNAAAALSLLGNNPHLVWFYPDPTGALIDPAEWGVWSILPRWTYSVGLLLILTTLAFMFWRGRRFGPLAYEKLPVTVKSSETVVSHGHLVHQTKDTGWAIKSLQRQAQRKIRKALLLPDEMREETFVSTVAQRVGRSDQEIYNLLFAPFTGNENQMVKRAKELDALIEEVVHD